MALGNWTEEVPIRKGFYWFKGNFKGTPTGEPIIIEATDGRKFYFPGVGRKFYEADFIGLWTGPILPPELPPQ